MSIKIEPTGVVMIGICSVKTAKCVARTTPEPITAVYQLPEQIQINVCGACLAEKIGGSGEWESETPLLRGRFDSRSTPNP